MFCYGLYMFPGVGLGPTVTKSAIGSSTQLAQSMSTATSRAADASVRAEISERMAYIHTAKHRKPPGKHRKPYAKIGFEGLIEKLIENNLIEKLIENLLTTC